ncbi:MAG: thioredoxin domain-containing protein [Polyangiales bacterium]
MNRLADARSPYLLQHAHNPVDWWPWCDEAFARAEAEGKPVFLSVGYSACHWCHVMERESFADPAVAEALARDFIAIKLDREERPDLDHTYQRAYQLLTQRGGGWPLSMFLTPQRAPFFGGTYFPDRPRHGMPSFREVLTRVAEVWRAKPDDVLAQARALTEALRAPDDAHGDPREPDRAWLDEAARDALRRVDPAHGGFGHAPKFPNATAHALLLLAGVTTPTSRDACVDAVARTLDAMARGGIRDHLGGGYARYSTDRAWRVPHFEKMLYDNALLLRLFVDAWRALEVAPSPALSPARCVAEVDAIAAWVAREMTSPEGAFYSAQDADSEGEEGRFFVWSPAELAAALSPDDARFAAAYFDVTPEGTFHGGRSVLCTPRARDDVAAALDLSPDDARAAEARVRAKLFEARETRPRPATDDKCLACWNGLLAGALADAGATLQRPALVDAAARCVETWARVAWRDGRLAHAMRGGEAWGDGFLDDHGALAGAALDLWEATFAPRWLRLAADLCAAIMRRFHDPATGALFFTAADAEAVITRGEDPVDSAHPSGVGLALDALLRAGLITGDASLQRAAAQGVRRYGPVARGRALGMSSTLLAVDRAARGSVEVIVVGDAPDALLAAARALPLPHRTLLWAPDAATGVGWGVTEELLAHRTAGAGGAAVAYVCRGDACEMPARSPAALRETLLRVLTPEG